MKIDPIPIELLTDSVTLLTPTDSGYSGTVLGNVRVIRTSTVTDHLVTHTRDRSELVVYFDCVNSTPMGTEFNAGQSLEYFGESTRSWNPPCSPGRSRTTTVSAEERPAANSTAEKGGKRRDQGNQTREIHGMRQGGSLPPGKTAARREQRARTAAEYQKDKEAALGGTYDYHDK